MKNDKTKPIIWATVALVIGVVIGAFLIGPMTTTGNAKGALIANNNNSVVDLSKSSTDDILYTAIYLKIREGGLDSVYDVLDSIKYSVDNENYSGENFYRGTAAGDCCKNTGNMWCCWNTPRAELEQIIKEGQKK